MDCLQSPRTSCTVTGQNGEPYHWFSCRRSDQNIQAELDNFQKTHTDVQCATLPFMPGSHGKLQGFISTYTFKVFGSGTAKERGQVFIHLIRSFNQHHANRQAQYEDKNQNAELSKILTWLRELIGTINITHGFRAMDLDGEHLNKLDMSQSKLGLESELDLSYSTFKAAALVRANLTKVIVTGVSTNDTTDLTGVIGFAPPPHPNHPQNHLPGSANSPTTLKQNCIIC